MEQCLISVIVPVYKVEEYLPRCVESILTQTYRNLEIILVDDGSPDWCGEICDEYAKKDSRIHVVHKKNGGLSDARNVALDIANGEYIGFVDSDDWIEPEMFEVLYHHRVEEGITVCGWYFDFADYSKPQLLSAQKYTAEEGVKAYLQQELEFLFDKPAMGSYAWNKLYHYKLFENIRYPVGRKYEDIAIILSLLSKSSQMVVVNQCLYHYIQRDNSITHNSVSLHLDFLLSRKEQLQKVNKFWPELLPYMEALLLVAYFFCAIQYVRLSAIQKEKNRDFWIECKQKFKKIHKIKKYIPNHIFFKFYLCIYAPFVFVWLSRIKHLMYKREI